MENPLILVADADPKNLQILRDSLESSGFSVISANDGILAWEKIQSQHPDLILSEVNLPNYDGFQLLEKLKEDPITSIIPVMFLTNRREIQDRVRSLRGGVKDYMIKPLHVKEVIARIRMILRRIERVKSDDSDSSKKMAGRLEEYSVIELIDNFGAERKTGVLQIYNEHNRNGEIWFKYGAVVHASFGTLKAEKAVYQMLPWQRGHFIMTFKEVQVPETINISNLGLLLHGYKRMEQREQLFKQLPSPETTFVLTEAFRKVVFRKELSQEASKFIALIDGRRDIMQIIDESVYDDIHTLERLVKLHKEGLIRHGAPSDQTSTEINIAAPTLNDVKEELTNSSEHLDYDEVHEDENNIVPTLHEQESVTPSETNDYHTDNDFPPPDYDALDNDNEDEVENPLQNDIKQPELPEKVFSKELENESTTPENKEFTALENRDDHIVRHPATSQPIDLQDNVHSNQIVGEHEENTFDSEFTEQDKYHPPVGVPEPLKYSELSPNIDIPNALSEQKSTQQPEPNIHSDHELEPRAIFPEQPISEEGKPEENDTDEYAEHQISAPVPVPDQPDARKLTYSFPLRSYGKPRIEKKTENDTAPSKQEDTKSQLKNDMEEGTSSDIISTHLTDQAQQAKAEPQEPITPPKIPQVQKADAKIPLQKPQPKRIEQKSFTDLEHLIPKQKPPQKQHEANPVENPSIKIDKRISTETKTILADYFENKQIENPKFVLIGTERKFIEPFAANLLDGNTLNESKSQVFEYFAAREQRLNPSITFTLIGVTMEKQFTHLLDKISSDLAGCVLLIDASDKSKLNYISYLHTTLKEKYDCDYGIAIYDGANNRNLALDTVKDLIGAKEEDLVMKLEKNNERDHLHFLREMLNETKKNTHNR